MTYKCSFPTHFIIRYKMSKRKTLRNSVEKNNNDGHTFKSRKGISPVIATVILVAVAVVIAGSLAGFSSSLFGSYASHSEISVTSITMTTGGTGSLVAVNKGSTADTVTQVAGTSIGSDSAPEVGGATPATVPANSAGTTVTFDLGTPSPALVEGQQVSLTVTMQSGSTMTLSAIVS